MCFICKVNSRIFMLQSRILLIKRLLITVKGLFLSVNTNFFWVNGVSVTVKLLIFMVQLFKIMYHKHKQSRNQITFTQLGWRIQIYSEILFIQILHSPICLLPLKYLLTIVFTSSPLGNQILTVCRTSQITIVVVTAG